LNGIRVAVKRKDILADSVAFHFFARNIETGASSIQSPLLSSNGRFDRWPDGFLDEWSRALDELLDG
jgi:predicted ATPase